MMAADYGMAVHYEDDGEWKEIDNRFVYEAATENDPMEGFTTAEGDTKFKFAAESGNSGAVRAETGDYSVSFQFLGETDAAVPEAVNEIETEAAENAVTSVGYEDVRPGVSLQYMAKRNSLKEYILLSGHQDFYEYSFRLELGGLEAVREENGGISLYDPEVGTEVFEIPSSYKTDAAGAYSDAVEMVLTEESEDSCILTITADKEWIEDETRVFPVAIDPTLNEKLSTSSRHFPIPMMPQGTSRK